MIVRGKDRNQVAKLVGGSRESMQEKESGIAFRPSFAIEYFDAVWHGHEVRGRNLSGGHFFRRIVDKWDSLDPTSRQRSDFICI